MGFLDTRLGKARENGTILPVLAQSELQRTLHERGETKIACEPFLDSIANKPAASIFSLLSLI